MIQRLVMWGGGTDLDSFRWIYHGFSSTARKLGIPVVHVPDSEATQHVVQAGDTVISVDVWSKHTPYVAGVDYVLHNYPGDTHPLCLRLQDTPERLLRLQVWSTDASGEPWGDCRSYDRQARTLFQPWGTDLLAEEFLEPTFNPQSRDVVFIGAVWSDEYQGTELGNEAAIQELKEACDGNGLTFRHYTHVSNEQMVRLTREARLAPVVVGGWQCQHGYLPCRAFKTASYGVPVFTNSPYVSDLFWGGDSGDEVPVGEIIEGALRMRKDDYLDAARADQRIASNFTYREALQFIDRALQEGR